MKKYLILIISILYSVGFLPGTSVHAQEQYQSHIDQETLTMLPPLDVQTNLLAQEDDVPVVARGPAAPLTDMWVYAVGSTNCGWEYTYNYLDSGRILTMCDHGGEQLRAAVLEIGYGFQRFAKMNNSLLPSSAMYASTPVCVTGGYYAWPCSAGQIVAGFLNEYNLDGHQNGIFQYENTSANSPFNTMGVFINIW